MRYISRVFLLAGLAACALVLPAEGIAQGYPAKPVRVVVPFSAGGIADIRARQFAQRMSDALGQAVIVENKPGASGAIGAEYVAKSPADGYTLLFGTINELALVPAMGGQYGYNAQKDFAAISLASAGYPALVVAPNLGVNSVAELIALVKAKPGQFNFASAGSATHQHFMAGYFSKKLGLETTLVPYKGSAPAYPDLMTGQVHMILGYTLEFAQYAKAGRVKPLAVFGPRKVPLLGDVQTISEAGYPGYEVYGWQGFFAPAATPPEILQRLNAEIVKAGGSPEMQKILTEGGSEFIVMTPAEFGQFYRGEITKWAKIVKESGVKIE
jgi:tripartite-type tricarboxylate transporter receptor subunit TctC